MGQANAARDKLYDLRECRLSETDASGFDLSGVIMSKTDVSKAKFIESQFSKAFLQGNIFISCVNSTISSLCKFVTNAHTINQLKISILFCQKLQIVISKMQILRMAL